MIMANNSQISQVLMNLCVNARDAIPPEGGRVQVRLTMARVDGRCAEWLAAQPAAAQNMDLIHLQENPDGSLQLWMGLLPGAGTYLRLAVEDNGSGIERRTLEHIFEPFFTTKAIGKGTGLGLAAVQGIIAAHDGAMTVYSKPGQGTRFEIYWPWLQTAVVVPAAAPVAAEAAGAGRILVVDDEQQVRTMLETALQRKGYQVECCGNARDALDLFSADPQGWDMLITDQMMPGMNGDELARRIAARRPGLPIILCSGYVSTLTPEQQTAAGITLLVQKPVDLVKFTQIVRKKLAAGVG